MDANEREQVKNVVERIVEHASDLEAELSTDESPEKSVRVTELGSAIQSKASEAQAVVERSPERFDKTLRGQIRILDKHVEILMGVLPGDNTTQEPREVLPGKNTTPEPRNQVRAVRDTAEEIRSSLHERHSREVES